MDFYQMGIKERKDGPPLLYPDWIVGRSKDLMVRGRAFYAIWDEEAQMWSKDEYDVQRLVDEDLHRFNADNGGSFQVQSMRSFNTQSWGTFRKFMQNISDNSHSLDENLIFANTEVRKSDYASHRLPYALERGNHDAWDELISTLYSPEEREKIEWAIGAVVSGDSKKIQKFLVFYGPGGTGKSTVLNIIHKLFKEYSVTFDAKALGSSNNAFATEVFKSNPLVAIQHDGDLSKIEDNTKLNSIISHEELPMNEKYKPIYSARVNAFLFMGTNQPVKISDAKSGIIRRLIDVRPTGVIIDPARYAALMSMIDFELGAIAYHCLERYHEMGKNYYNSYRPIEMMLQTDVFYNYVEWCYDIFKKQDGVTLKQAYELYKEFCAETGIDKYLPQYKFREELRNYFNDFSDRAEVDGVTVRSYYSGFKKLESPSPFKPYVEEGILLDIGIVSSTFDRAYPDQPAQYAKKDGSPEKRWAEVTTTLKDIDTSQLHFVQVPEQHIVIDFDLVDDTGEKDFVLNLAEAVKWPPTYTELSKSGRGIHLHYIYTGDVHELASHYGENIEVKTLLGGSALRRKLTKCNNLEIATISGGLPKKEKPVLENKSMQSEKSVRTMIERNLRKEFHPGTKSSIDFIYKILEDAYESGMAYDVSDLRPTIFAFAASSTNQSEAAIKMVQKMKFASEVNMQEINDDDHPIVFFDTEVFPNLFVVCWKYQGADEVAKMVNPTPAEIEELFQMRLVGFNNRRYDNHILYARFLGYDLEEIYKLNYKIVNTDTKKNSNNILFGEAYNLSYTDIYDFLSVKKSLKKLQIELGLYHQELDLPWDQPVPEELWDTVVEYCVNDVISTEKVFEHKKQDFVARQILSELSGLTVNHTTQAQTAKIIFGEDKSPQDKFVYTDLSKMFKGYKFELGKSSYRGEDPSEGGYVYAEPGVYENVAVLDVASMHPTSTLELNLFGPYTERYRDLIQARLAIKRKDLKALEGMLGGKLVPFAQEGTEEELEALSYALKIVINIVYGLTSAKFPNMFRDNRNVDNIVAKRGALFMIDLKNAVQDKGYTVAHIKTDSIKIPDATPEIIEFITEFGKKYGYDFEHESTYDKFCLVNDAVYIAREGDKWNAVGAQFQHPYVFKSLFTNEEITFDDLCEAKSVTQGTMYLDFNESELRKVTDYVHVGRTGSFVPVINNGATLWRIKDDKKYAVTGTKGYRWIERDMALAREESYLDFVDFSYFEKLKDEAEKAIEYYGSFARFIS